MIRSVRIAGATLRSRPHCSLRPTRHRICMRFSGPSLKAPPAAMPPSSPDDRIRHVLPFLLSQLRAHNAAYSSQRQGVPALFLGLNGAQGAGKTTLVRELAAALRAPPYNISTVVLSIDDLYFPYEEQRAIANSHPDNPLVQHRGLPGTHDIGLGIEAFGNLKWGMVMSLPAYDKSARAGHGDRVDESEWKVINQGPFKVRIVLFEGWCVGFRSMEPEELEQCWKEAVLEQRDAGNSYQGRLAWNRLENLEFVNAKLLGYDRLTDQLDAFVHLDAEDPKWVYDWRLEQEAALRAEKGSGMSNEQVIDFVDGYYPAYELYTGALRGGIFPDRGRQLSLIIGKDRKVKESVRL